MYLEGLVQKSSHSSFVLPCLKRSTIGASPLEFMIVCKHSATDGKEVEERVLPPQEAGEKSCEFVSSESKLAALRALGALGFHIVHYSCQESKFRVQLIGAPAGLCVDLSSQEYFRFSQAMDSQLEDELKVPELINSTEENVTELSPAEKTKRTTTGKRYLKKLLPMLRFKGQSEKANSQLQMRQRISMFMVCLLRLFEKKKKTGKAPSSTCAPECAHEDLKVEASVAVSS